MRKTKLVLLSVLVFFLLFPFTVSADAGWYTCSIDMIGSATNVIFIRLTDTNSTPAFQKTWFVIRADRSKEMLAAGLTAVNMDKKISVRTEAIDPYSDLTAIYLINE